MKRFLFPALFITLYACQYQNAPINTNQSLQAQSQTRNLSQELQTKLQSASPTRSLKHFTQPSSSDLQAIPQDPKNPLTPAKVQLGQLLYHDTALGLKSEYAQGMESYSCATCHHTAGGLQANRRQGLSDGAIGFGLRGEKRRPSPLLPPEKIDFQPVRTPAAINTAWQKNMLWNGQFGANGANAGTQALWQTRANSTLFPGIQSNHLGFDGVETQAIAGQDAHRLSLDKVKTIPAYQDLFAQAYPELPANKRITQINAGMAIAAFERTMLSNQSPFQRWLRGDQQAMSAAELRGGIVFVEAKCTQCHTGPALNSMRFEAKGLGDLIGNDVVGSNPNAEQHMGRASFTKKPEDMFKFKVPQLYNLADSPFYGHGGSIQSLEAFVDYMNKGQPQNPKVNRSQLSPSFKPLNLSATQMRDLVAFLKTGLRDPDLKRYQPNRVPSGNCMPNNDPESRRDLGC